MERCVLICEWNIDEDNELQDSRVLEQYNKKALLPRHNGIMDEWYDLVDRE